MHNIKENTAFYEKLSNSSSGPVGSGLYRTNFYILDWKKMFRRVDFKDQFRLDIFRISIKNQILD